MSTAEPQPANADQIATWNAEIGQRWAQFQAEIDVMFAALTETVIEAASVQEGESVIDIGCGCGTTVLELARRVGVGGSVLGVDVSTVMLDVASRRSGDLPQVRLVEADAASYAFPGGADLIFSRFGVMFFDDPVAAFANIRSALAPGGRLTVGVWRSLAENEWAELPVRAARAHLPAQPLADPYAPGPFAFADADRLRQILTAAGFSAIDIRPHDPPIRLGAAGQTHIAAARALRVGPVARTLAEIDDAVRERVLADVLDAFTQRETPDGLVLGGGIWIVRATH